MLAIILLAIIGLFVVVNMLKALIRGLKKSIGTLVAILLSAIVSAIITSIVCNPKSGAVMAGMDMIKGILPEGAIQDLFTVEALGEALSYYAAMLVAPFFFVLVYVVLSLIFGIIVAILVKIVPPFKKPNALLNRLGGTGVGLVCGLLVAIIVLMPIVGTLNMVSGLLDTVGNAAGESAENTETADSGDLDFLMDELVENPAVNVLINTGCGALYDAFASADFEGERVYLKNDIAAIVGMVEDFTVLGEEMSQYDSEQVKALERIIGNLDSSLLLKHTVSGVFSTASQRWTEGETFIGMEKFDAGELLNPVVDEMLVIMQTSDRTNITADLTTMKNVFAILIENELLKDSENYEDMLSKLSSENIISDLILSVTSNKRMAPLADCITEISVRALASAIGIPENADAVYNQLMEELATVLNGNTSNTEEVKNGISSALDNYGIQVDGEALDHITSSMIADLGGRNNLTAEDVSEFFTVYAIASAQGDNAAENESGVSYLANKTSPKFVFNADGTVSVDGKVLKNYTVNNLQASKAYTMGIGGVNFGNAGTLLSSETMVSYLITMEDIMDLLGQYANCENIEEEAEKIAGLLGEAMGILEDVDMSNPDLTYLMDKFGSLLDRMSDTNIFGDGTADQLLKALLQSDKITSSLGIRKSELTSMADKITNMANNDTGSYSDATSAVSSTVNMLTSVTDKNKTEEEKKKATEDLLHNITPDSAELLTSIVTPSLVADMGVPETSSESASAMMSSMLDKMANFDTEKNGAEAVQKEVDAVNEVMNIAMNISTDTNDNRPMFSENGEEGKINSTPEEFIDLIVTSEVMSATLVETVHENGHDENPLGVPELSEADQTTTEAALQQYYTDNKTDENSEELQQKLDAIASILNMDISFQ